MKTCYNINLGIVAGLIFDKSNMHIKLYLNNVYDIIQTNNYLVNTVENIYRNVIKIALN